jgi:hypothetical protein
MNVSMNMGTPDRADVKRGSLLAGMKGIVTQDHWKAY